MGYLEDLSTVSSTILSEYRSKTDKRLKLVDCYLLYCLCTGAVQVRCQH